MSTIERAVELLDLLDSHTPEIGLTEVHRKTGRDKATCHRHLVALQSVGLLEQNPITKKYRMGPAVLRWAALREASVPRKTSVKVPLEQLAAASGELAHVSMLNGTTLTALADCDAGQHSTRVVIDEKLLPLHATASGLAVLAYASADLLEAAHGAMRRFTDNTITTKAELNRSLHGVRTNGFAESNEGFELGVHGISAPIFDASCHACGAISVASVAARMTPHLGHIIRMQLITAARDITQLWGGTVPGALDQIWHSYLNASERRSA